MLITDLNDNEMTVHNRLVRLELHVCINWSMIQNFCLWMDPHADKWNDRQQGTFVSWFQLKASVSSHTVKNWLII